jgi:hypothetical protein
LFIYWGYGTGANRQLDIIGDSKIEVNLISYILREEKIHMHGRKIFKEQQTE